MKRGWLILPEVPVLVVPEAWVVAVTSVMLVPAAVPRVSVVPVSVVPEAVAGIVAVMIPVAVAQIEVGVVSVVTDVTFVVQQILE